MHILPPTLAPLRVPDELVGRWLALPPAARWYLDTYVSGHMGETRHLARGFVGAFADDHHVARYPQNEFEGVLAGMRTPFPRLARTLGALEYRVDAVSATVACEGVHEGTLFGILLPTGRPVHFNEQHTLTLNDAKVETARFALDLRGLIGQVCG
jgi:predicted ester cyclase